MEWKWKKEKRWVEHNFPHIVRVEYRSATTCTCDGFVVIQPKIWDWLEKEIGPVHNLRNGWSWDRDEENKQMVLGFTAEGDAVLFKLVWGIEG